MGNRGGLGNRRLLLHLGIEFNPEVSFESVVYHWKSLSGLFLMDLLGGLFGAKNAAEKLSEGRNITLWR